VSELQAGEHIGGRYRLEQRLGAGGMGEVWLAELHGAGAFRRQVVLKLLAPARRGDERLASMLADEARVVGLLHHPGIVAAIDYLETEEHGPVFVLEFVDGASLRAILKVLRQKDLTMPEPLAAWIGAQVARALHAAHTALISIVHRDVAPDNVLIARCGTVWLGDFGVALASDTWESTNPGGAPKGKKAYMAPEQAMGHQVGPPADIFALGKVIAEATTAGPALAQVLARATAESPEDRQPDAASLAAELLTACPPPPDPEGELSRWLRENACEVMLERKKRKGGALRSEPPPAGRAPQAPRMFKSMPPPRAAWLKVAAVCLALTVVALIGVERRRLRFFTAALAGVPESQHGELKITSRPQEAEVYVDGRFRGSTPIDLDLPTGRHSIRLGSARMGKFRAAEVTIKDGIEHRLDVDLSE
jgi:serine/threonine protein kinase